MATIFSLLDRTLAATVTSTSAWQATLPVTNVQTKLLSKKARTTVVTGTQNIRIDLGATGRAIRVVALLAHNLTYGATVHCRGFSDAAYTSQVSGADTGVTTYAFPQTLGSEDAANYPKNWIFCFSAAISTTARYWQFEIVDTGNTVVGYIEVGRAWLGEEFDPGSKVEYGMSLGYESRDKLEESLGGVVWGEKLEGRRICSGSIPNLKTTAKQKALIMQKTIGTVNEVLFIPDTAATALDMILEAFPATLRDVSPLQYAYFGGNDMSFSLLEII